MVTVAGGPRPGLGLDIMVYTEEDQRNAIFPLALLGDWRLSPAPTLRERAMLTFMNSVTDMPGWDDKVLNDQGVRKLELEQFKLAGLPQPESSPRHHKRKTEEDEEDEEDEDPGCGFSAAMFQGCIAELQHKARDFKSTGIVGVLDVNAAILKKDTPEEFRSSIAESLKGVEDEALAQRLKNWQPDHNETLLKVVQPMLYPIVSDRTRVLTDRVLGLADCLDAVGSGHVIDLKAATASDDSGPGFIGRRGDDEYSSELSRENQWLPTEVVVDAEGKAHIASYINNLHPVEHADVYRTVEHILDQALPMFSATYNSVQRSPGDHVRFSEKDFKTLSRACKTPSLCASQGGCKPRNWIQNWIHGHSGGTPDSPFRGQADSTEWYASTHRSEQPEPVPIVQSQKSTYVGADYFTNPAPWATVEDETRTGRLQIFVTVGNILLTPDKPKYETGAYHVEGIVNERICASAIYYYDSQNITDSRLSFKAAADSSVFREGMDEGQCLNLYGLRCAPGGCASPPSVEVGSVESRPGRLVVFPNVFAHRVDPFELKDQHRPGHRKVVGIFLVDPKTPIISTANVPPQQLHWAPQNNALNVVDCKLPPELSTTVYEDVGCPYSLEEAHKITNAMLKDRSDYASYNLKTLPYRGYYTRD